jgi:3-hydroxymyristoyl/3-hydroxydecanoyl-(acyl carrier protein) dehydratase
MLQRIEVDLATKTARAVKIVSGSEPFALGHYAGNPIYPGVLSVEHIMALAEALVSKVHEKRCRVDAIKRVQFTGMAGPGDVLTVEASITKEDDGGCLIKGSIASGDRVTARGTLHVVFE